MSNQGGIQLLPETRRKIDIKTPGENRWMYAGIAVVLLVVVATGALMMYKNSLQSKLEQIDSDIVKLEEQRNKKSESNLLILNKQLSMITTLLNDHIFWSKAMGKVESLTQPQVQFATFNASSGEGKFEIKAFTSNYTVLAKQIAAYLSDDSVKDVDLNDVHVLTNGRLEFNIRLSFDKAKFIKEQNEPK